MMTDRTEQEVADLKIVEGVFCFFVFESMFKNGQIRGTVGGRCRSAVIPIPTSEILRFC